MLRACTRAALAITAALAIFVFGTEARSANVWPTYAPQWFCGSVPECVRLTERNLNMTHAEAQRLPAGERIGIATRYGLREVRLRRGETIASVTRDINAYAYGRTTVHHARHAVRKHARGHKTRHAPATLAAANAHKAATTPNTNTPAPAAERSAADNAALKALELRVAMLEAASRRSTPIAATQASAPLSAGMLWSRLSAELRIASVAAAFFLIILFVLVAWLGWLVRGLAQGGVPRRARHESASRELAERASATRGEADDERVEHLEHLVGRHIICPIHPAHARSGTEAPSFHITITELKEAVRGAAGVVGRGGRRLTLTLLGRTEWDAEYDDPVEVGYVDADTRIIYKEQSLSRLIGKAQRKEDMTPRGERIRAWLAAHEVLPHADNPIVDRRAMRLAEPVRVAA